MILITPGEFEHLLTTAAAGLGDNAYGVAIRKEIEATTERKRSLGAVYTTIDRAEVPHCEFDTGLPVWYLLATARRTGRD